MMINSIKNTLALIVVTAMLIFSAIGYHSITSPKETTVKIEVYDAPSAAANAKRGKVQSTALSSLPFKLDEVMAALPKKVRQARWCAGDACMNEGKR